jgi:hypothetical protein
MIMMAQLIGWRSTLISALVMFASVAYSQTGLLENFSTVRTAIGSTTPMWGVYTGTGGGGSPCTTQSWSISGGTGNDVIGPNSCPYMDTQVGEQGGTPGGYGYPNGYLQSYLLTGSWTPNFNRISYSMNCNSAWPMQTTTSTVGTYIRQHGATDPTFQGQHYYHLLANAVNSGEWYYFTLNGHPQHQVGQGSGINWPNDPEYVNPTTGAAVHYYDGLTRWYVNPYFLAIASGSTCEFGPISFSAVSGESDEDVSTVTGSYDGTAYHADWAGPKNVTESFTVHYATASMHTNGFSSGTDCGTTPQTQGDTYTYVNWTCTVAQVPNLYVAIRPHPVVIGATGNGVSPIRLSFAADPMWAANDQITVSGVSGNTAANGTFNLTPHTWQFWTIANSGLSQIVVSGGVATVTTASAHNLETGQAVMVYNPNDPNTWGYAPLYTVTVTGSTTFTFPTTQPNATYNSSSTPSLQVWSLPSVDLQGSTGNGAYTSGGSVVATSDTNDFTEISMASGLANACDLNSDGVVNSTDVNLAVQMALGQIVCTANINGAGVCNVVTVQRVINATLGQGCNVN